MGTGDGNLPEKVKAGCYGRMMEDSDNVFIADKSAEPECSQNLWSAWKNGATFYFPAMATVQDLKQAVSETGDGKVPAKVKAGCYGRMMEDSDNLALAVRTFCQRDPKIVLWEEELA